MGRYAVSKSSPKTRPKLTTGWWLCSARASEIRGATSPPLSVAPVLGPGPGRSARLGDELAPPCRQRSHVDPGSRQVELLRVLVEHARRGEAPDRAGHGPLHERQPLARKPGGGPFVVAGHHLVLQDPVEVQRIGPVLGALVWVRDPAADGPAVVSGPALVPPPVEHRQVDHAVRGTLHARRPSRLHLSAWIIQPDVNAAHYEIRDQHAVVLSDEYS